MRGGIRSASHADAAPLVEPLRAHVSLRRVFAGLREHVPDVDGATGGTIGGSAVAHELVVAGQVEDDLDVSGLFVLSELEVGGSPDESVEGAALFKDEPADLMK